jgi:hypothetical protein
MSMIFIRTSLRCAASRASVIGGFSMNYMGFVTVKVNFPVVKPL